MWHLAVVVFVGWTEGWAEGCGAGVFEPGWFGWRVRARPVDPRCGRKGRRVGTGTEERG